MTLAHDRQNMEALADNLRKIMARAIEINLSPTSPIIENARLALMRVEAARQIRVEVPLEGTKPKDRPFALFYQIHRHGRSTTYSTWYVAGIDATENEVIVGAAHSNEAWPADRRNWPLWTQGKPLITRPGGLDLSIFGDPAVLKASRDLKRGDRVLLRGFPAGVDVPQFWIEKRGYAYMERNEGGVLSWIIEFDDGTRSAVGGMSGGPVSLIQDGGPGSYAPNERYEGPEELVATLITRNTPVNLDDDEWEERGSDVTEHKDALRKIAVAA